MRCHKEQIRSQFSKYCSKTKQRWLITYEKPLIQFGSDILKIVAVALFCDTSHFCLRIGFCCPQWTLADQNRVKKILYPPFI